MSSNNNNNNNGNSAMKKAKLDPPGRDEDDSEFEAVKNYIRACPVVAPHHPAVIAALEGIDRELAKRKRDAVLKAKFLQESVTVEHEQQQERNASSPDLILVEKNTSSPASSEGQTKMNTSIEALSVSDDWHEVREHENGEDTMDEGGSHSSSVGAELAREVISSIALFEVRAVSPVHVIALALHAALRGPLLGFACTGIPESNTSSGGFAAPVRELPKCHFLPKEWNSNPNLVVLRYRKKGVGSMILRVEDQPSPHEFDANDVSMERVWIKVSVIPNASSFAEKDVEPSDSSLTFAASDYINLSSFQLALASQTKSGGVAPALHYKSLPTLLTRFVETFDLGGVKDTPMDAEGNSSTNQELPYVDSTVRNLPVHNRQPPTGTTPPSTSSNPHHYDESQPPTIDSAFPGLRRPTRGDFSEDFMIGGGGGFPGMDGSGSSPFVGGNLMGPNHPYFVGGGGPGMSGVGPNSGFGMRPRFDPVGGPPGGPTDTNPTTKHPRGTDRRNLGDPNPDHLSPPNSFHSNMFM